MYTAFIQSLNNMIYQVEQAEVFTKPWPHMYVNEVISKDYRDWLDYESADNLVHYYDELGGRDDWVLTPEHVHSADLRLFNKLTDKLFYAIADKFGNDVQDAPEPTCRFWKDTDKLLINDIHTDEFYDPTNFTISAMIYLPKDNSQRHYGTRLYSYIGDDLTADAVQDEGMANPHMAHPDKEHKWKHELTVPFMPNTMFITTNGPGTWHQAPTNIAPGDVRESVMIRWKCEY